MNWNEVPIDITAFQRHRLPGERSTILAIFDATIGPFRMRRCALRESAAGGRFVSGPLAGEDNNPTKRKRSGIALENGTVRDRLLAGLVELYDEGATI